jgi:anti-anti-sigma regulatory factor
VHGELDSGATAKFAHCVESVRDHSSRRLVIDLTGVIFLSVSGCCMSVGHAASVWGKPHLHLVDHA